MIVRFAVYPLIVIGGGALLIILPSSGVAAWPLAPFVLVAASFLVVLLERLLPYVRAWNRDHGDARTDVLHFVGNLAVNHASIATFALAREVWSGAGLWPVAAPFWAQALLGLVIVDDRLVLRSRTQQTCHPRGFVLVQRSQLHMRRGERTCLEPSGVHILNRRDARPGAPRTRYVVCAGASRYRSRSSATRAPFLIVVASRISVRCSRS